MHHVDQSNSIILLSGQALVGLCEGLMDQTTRYMKCDKLYIKENDIMLPYMQG